VIGQADDAVSAVHGTFASNQPPNADADRLPARRLKAFFGWLLRHGVAVPWSMVGTTTPCG
jgi:hypothetical protein